MVADRQATIDVVWGLTLQDDRLENELDVSSLQNQEALFSFCDRASNFKPLKIAREYCWLRDFKTFLKTGGRSFPSQDFIGDLRDFLDERPLPNNVGLDDSNPTGRRVKWVSVSFKVNFDTHSSGHQVLPYMKVWESFVDQEFEHYDGRGPGKPVPLAEIFVRAEAESRIVNSAVSSWLVSVGCALLAIIAFTRSFFLSAIAAFAMFGTAACSLYTIVVIFQWHFGLMEAVSLIVFSGFSVDYPLHVVQAYVQEKREGNGIKEALREVGCAITSGCITTVGAAAFLLLCEIRIFTRFGQVLMCNMVFALLFALLWIPALLFWCELRQAPKVSSGDARRRGVGGGAEGDELLFGEGAPRPTWLQQLQQDGVDPEGFAALVSDAEN